MSLLAFMNYMTKHPDEMAAYKQDPQAFFDKHPDIALTGDDQRALQGYYRPAIEESTTVFRLAITLEPGPAANTNTALPTDICGEGTICLEGVWVNVYAHSEAHVFFAEPLVGTVSCITLRHSYLLINEQTKYFDLHLCCTDPGDETDRAQVLYIRTAGKTRPLNPQMCEHKPVSLTIPPSQDSERPGYILATAEGSQYFNNSVQLRPGSCYDPITKELVLNFDTTDIENE